MNRARALLATDMEGSTRLWEHYPEEMPAAHALHDRVILETIAAHDGERLLLAGDAVRAVFDSVDRAIEASIAIQRLLDAADWPLPEPIRARLAIHTSETDPDSNALLRSPDVILLDALVDCGHGGQILVSSTAAERVPARALLVDLGIYRLPGTSRASPIFQVRAEGLQASFPALRAHRAPATNLQAPPNRLVGRARELRELLETIYDRQARLVTLVGPGGIGKTRLAHQLALELRDARDETVWFVDLTPITDPEQVIPAILSTMRAQELGFAIPFDALAQNLDGQRVVLVLDNFEHVATAADMVAELLARLPELRVVVTSRSPLHVQGEWQFPVGSLSLPNSLLERWDELSVFESVQLFVDRVALAAPNTRLDDRHVSAVTGICQKLEGVPLAIELAAPRVRVLTIDELNERLEDRLATLSLPESDRSGRHRAMRASISWSYDLLPPDSQRFLRELGVLQSGFTFETIDGLLGDRFDVLAQVALLTEQNLVRPGGFQHEPDRFSMLESVRQFALELLEADGELHAARARHARYFSARALDRYPDPRDWDVAAVQDLRSELDELRAAIEWLTVHHRERALDMAVGAWRLWFVVGRLTEADRWLGQVLDATAGEDSVKRARALYGRALIGHGRATHERTIAFDSASLAMAERLGDQRGIGDACNHLGGIISLTTGDHLRGMELIERAVEAYTAIDDRHGIAESLLNRASLTFELGRLDEALVDGQLVLEYCRSEGKDVLASNTLYGVAGLAIFAGQFSLAIELLREALELSRRLGYDIFLSSVIAVLNILLLEAGRYEDALRLAEFTREFARNRTSAGDVSDPFQRGESDRLTMLANLSPESAERAMAAGARMTPVEAVDLGLSLLDQLSI